MLDKYQRMIWEQSLEIEVLTEELVKARRYNTLFSEKIKKQDGIIEQMKKDIADLAKRYDRN